MADEPPGLRDRYFRERRLLLGVTLVLLAHQLLGIEVGRSADTLGLHFEVSDPQRLWWGVWALWIWSLACCIQQLYSLRPYIPFPSERRTEIFQLLQRHLARLVIWYAVRASFRRQVERRNRVAYSVDVPLTTKVEHEDHLQAHVRVRWRNTPNQTRAVALVDDTAAGDHWIVRFGGDGRVRNELYHHGGVAIRPPATRILSIAATILTWTLTSTATDYVLPVVVGLSPLVIKVAGYERPAKSKRSEPSPPPAPARPGSGNSHYFGDFLSAL